MANTIELLDYLIGFKTVSRSSNLDIIQYIEDFLHTRGFRTTRLSSPDATCAGLYAETGPAAEGGIALSGHLDVVPVENQDWQYNPFKLTQVGDRYYGRGTTDMKGFVAAMLSAADRVKSQNMHMPLKLVFSYDEEIGCVGIQEMEKDLKSLIGTPQICIIGEPTEMQVAIGHKGKVAQEAHCYGKAGHSALAPQFVNPIDMAVDCAMALRKVRDDIAHHYARDAAYDIPYSTVHVGKIQGGEALNIVPSSASLSFECRYLAQDDPQHIQGLINDAIEKISDYYRAKDADAHISLKPIINYPAHDIDVKHPIVALGQRFAKSNSITKVAFGTEAGVFARMGIPTLICGPGSMKGQGHKPDEFISHSALMDCDRMLDQILEEVS